MCWGRSGVWAVWGTAEECIWLKGLLPAAGRGGRGMDLLVLEDYE